MKQWKCALLVVVAAGILTSCGPGKDDLSRVVPSGPSSSVSGEKEPVNPLAPVEEGPGANSGDKGVIYVVNYDTLSVQNDFRSSYRFRYDTVKLITAVQGLVNREKPTLYVEESGQEYSSFYFTYMRQQEGDWLYGYRRQEIRSLTQFLEVFGEVMAKNGLVAWDEDVPATANVATTVCGVDGLLPVRYDPSEGSLYTLLTQTRGYEVRMSLVDRFTGQGTIWQTGRASTGSAKCDAYLWALEHYMSRCSDAYLGLPLDAYRSDSEGADNPMRNSVYATALPNADFFVKNRVFCFDLTVFEDEAACDDHPSAVGADYRTMCEILKAQYDKHGGESFTQVIGVPSILWKYTQQTGTRYSDVELEFRYGEILSSYNAVCDGDCPGLYAIFNASIYQDYPLKERYENQRPASIGTYDPEKVYVMFFMGDYDSGAWTTSWSMQAWRDGLRGEIPLAWGFNPNLSERVPVVFDYLWSTATENDYFVGGDSGAGYLYPSFLLQENRTHSGLKDGLSAWVDWNTRFYNRFDLTITGYVHNALHPFDGRELAAYSSFSPDGIALLDVSDQRGYTIGSMPVFTSYETVAIQDVTPIEDALKLMDSKMARRGSFYLFRTVICSPTYMVQLAEALKAEHPAVEIVDPYTFFAYLQQSLS